jgi:hypothetical protein
LDSFKDEYSIETIVASHDIKNVDIHDDEDKKVLTQSIMSTKNEAQNATRDPSFSRGKMIIQ